MTIKECYEQMGADYEDVRSRLRSDLLIRKFFLKFSEDKSFGQLKAALEAGAREDAFRGAHTLKGVAQNLGFTPLYEAAHRLTEDLRPENREAACAEIREAFERVNEAYDTIIKTAEQFVKEEQKA